jgi:hypothetical protein
MMAIMQFSALLVSAGPPAAVVVLQIWLKLAFRQVAVGQKWRNALNREDFTWWVDWMVSAVISVFVFLIGAFAALEPGKTLTISEVNTSFAGSLWILVILLLVGFSVLPVYVNRLGYLPASSNNPPKLRPVVGILLPDLVGGMLFAAVLSAGYAGATGG